MPMYDLATDARGPRNLMRQYVDDLLPASGPSVPVHLVFPPLVENNFGAYYPSTAVLAAALGGAGLACAQVDLNEALALWLVDTAREPRRGDDLTDTADVVAAAAADIVGHARHPMVDADGRHLFCDVAPGSASSESGSSDGARAQPLPARPHGAPPSCRSADRTRAA